MILVRASKISIILSPITSKPDCKLGIILSNLEYWYSPNSKDKIICLSLDSDMIFLFSISAIAKTDDGIKNNKNEESKISLFKTALKYH